MGKQISEPQEYSQTCLIICTQCSLCTPSHNIPLQICLGITANWHLFPCYHCHRKRTHRGNCHFTLVYRECCFFQCSFFGDLRGWQYDTGNSHSIRSDVYKKHKKSNTDKLIYVYLIVWCMGVNSLHHRDMDEGCNAQSYITLARTQSKDDQIRCFYFECSSISHRKIGTRQEFTLFPQVFALVCALELLCLCSYCGCAPQSTQREMTSLTLLQGRRRRVEMESGVVTKKNSW